MKTTHYLLSSISALLMTATSSLGVLTVNPGDLLLGFYKVSVSSGAPAVAPNTYLFNLGPGATLREATYTSLNIGNINADLTTAFGSAWATDTGVRWGVFGGLSVTDPLTNGDPGRTVYLSKEWTTGPNSSSGLVFSSAQMGSLSTNITSFRTSMNGLPENGAINGGALVGSNAPNGLASFLPPNAFTSFGVSSDPMGTLGDPFEGLDIYRTLFNVTASGVDLTTAAAPGNAALRTQQYIGSLQLSSNGDLSFSAVPEPGVSSLSALAALSLFRRRRASTLSC
jgi:hypothetical protein